MGICDWSDWFYWVELRCDINDWNGRGDWLNYVWIGYVSCKRLIFSVIGFSGRMS